MNALLLIVFSRKYIIYLWLFYFQTFNSVLLDVQAVELASTIDHVTIAEMNAVTWVAGLDLLQVKQARNVYKTSVKKYSHLSVTLVTTILYLPMVSPSIEFASLN